MVKKQFSKTELKHIKFLLMKRGYTEKKANEEIGLMIKTAEENAKKVALECPKCHLKSIGEQKLEYFCPECSGGVLMGRKRVGLDYKSGILSGGDSKGKTIRT